MERGFSLGGKSSQTKPLAARSIMNDRGFSLLAPLRFLWNATRGHRLAPWRSDYLRWRIETFSGKRAETLSAADVLSFLWATRWEILSFLAWTNQLERETRKRA
jgi:hypothetical protein